jgi:lipoate-protein ligase A
MTARPEATLRSLRDPPLDGAVNMARDQALLEGVEAGTSLPTLRIYAWREPTLSLGYFQKFDEVAKQPPALRELPVVRRLTGGGAILHDLELTYCLALPIDHPLLAAGHPRLYDLAHAVIAAVASAEGLRVTRGPCHADGDACLRRGPFLCFHRHYPQDVLAAGRKLAGSAQRRTQRGLIQHGSLILASRFAEQACACLDPEQTRPYEGWAVVFALAWTEHLGIPLRPGTWTPAELADAEKWLNQYDGPAWTQMR